MENDDEGARNRREEERSWRKKRVGKNNRSCWTEDRAVRTGPASLITGPSFAGHDARCLRQMTPGPPVFSIVSQSHHSSVYHNVYRPLPRMPRLVAINFNLVKQIWGNQAQGMSHYFPASLTYIARPRPTQFRHVRVS